jgi:hypothetical protein
MERQSIEAAWLTLRKRLLHRGTSVDAWVGSLLRDEAA